MTRLNRTLAIVSGDAQAIEGRAAALAHDLEKKIAQVRSMQENRERVHDEFLLALVRNATELFTANAAANLLRSVIHRSEP